MRQYEPTKCPYCGYLVFEGSSAVPCHICGSRHHEACWSDNRGCAVTGCKGNPKTSQAAEAVLSSPVVPSRDNDVKPYPQIAAAETPYREPFFSWIFPSYPPFLFRMVFGFALAFGSVAAAAHLVSEDSLLWGLVVLVVGGGAGTLFFGSGVKQLCFMKRNPRRWGSVAGDLLLLAIVVSFVLWPGSLLAQINERADNISQIGDAFDGVAGAGGLSGYLKQLGEQSGFSALEMTRAALIAMKFGPNRGNALESGTAAAAKAIGGYPENLNVSARDGVGLVGVVADAFIDEQNDTAEEMKQKTDLATSLLIAARRHADAQNVSFVSELEDLAKNPDSVLTFVNDQQVFTDIKVVQVIMAFESAQTMAEHGADWYFSRNPSR